MRTSRILNRRLVWAILLLAACGCSRDDRIFVPVKGKVTWKGEPATYGVVTFVPKTKTNHTAKNQTTTTERVAFGIIDEHGNYEMNKGGVRQGVRPGDYEVGIRLNKLVIDDSPGPTPVEVDPLKGQYADPKVTGLTVTVPETAPEMIVNFELPIQ